MLGSTANGLFWMFRQLERSENTARLIETGFRMALTRQASGQNEWASVVRTAGCEAAFQERHNAFNAENVIDFLLRDPGNPGSVLSLFKAARTNARSVRTALTREVWESTNEAWLALQDLLANPVTTSELPKVLGAIRKSSALVRGAWHGTALRNDVFLFARLGTRIERADNTARILDVKYFVLLPSSAAVGSSLDNVQWETILRSASAARAFNLLYGGETSPSKIAEFLIFNQQLPRSLLYCCADSVRILDDLSRMYGEPNTAQSLARPLLESLQTEEINSIFKSGLHEFLGEFINKNNAIGRQIEIDFRFNE